MKKVRVFVGIEIEVQGIDVLGEVHAAIEQMNKEISNGNIIVGEIFDSEIVEIEED